MSFWTIEKIDLLRKLVSEKLPASKISIRLNCTKSMVSGKVNRLGLKLKGNPKKKIIYKPKKLKYKDVKYDKGIRETQSERIKDITNLKINECRWPEGHPGDPAFFFCAAMVKENKPYCEVHYAIAYVPYRQKSNVPFKEPNSSTRFNFKSR